MPIIVRVEAHEAEIPLLELSDHEAKILLAEKLFGELSKQHKLENPEYTRYARQLAGRDSPIFCALFDPDELELVQAAIADLRQKDPHFDDEDDPKIEVVE